VCNDKNWKWGDDDAVS